MTTADIERAVVLGELLSRPYARLIYREAPDLYVVEVLEFPGVAAEGATADEAVHKLDLALASVLDVILDNGEEVPDPLAAVTYSGRLNLRIPPRLHADAARAAAVENVSLNRFLSDAIARRIGATAQKAGHRGTANEGRCDLGHLDDEGREALWDMIETMYRKPPKDRLPAEELRAGLAVGNQY